MRRSARANPQCLAFTWEETSFHSQRTGRLQRTPRPRRVRQPVSLTNLCPVHIFLLTFVSSLHLPYLPNSLNLKAILALQKSYRTRQPACKCSLVSYFLNLNTKMNKVCRFRSALCWYPYFPFPFSLALLHVSFLTFNFFCDFVGCFFFFHFLTTHLLLSWREE